MIKKSTLLLLFLSLFIKTYSQKKNSKNNIKPKLVVGIVVDQMRYDYITRFYNRFGDGGFKKIIENGFTLENAHFNYIPTYTAVGHTSVYTGTTPNNHGIISNNWYDKYLKESIYCVTDTNYNSVGSDSKRGQRSPFRLMTTTITDQLHLAQNNKGKTIGIALKDRSAILPVGHTANAAYWYDGGLQGNFITSSFYMDNLPNWVNDFNNKKVPEKYLSKTWNTLYDIKTYTNSFDDNNDFEGTFKGKETPTFPYNLKELKDENGNLGMINNTPFGNSLTLDFAKAAIENENLGKGSYTDFLAISFSSTDYIGHKFGPQSIEIEDTYLRLDKDIEKLINYLDTKVGKSNYTLFLTADHGAVHVPAYLQSLKIPAHYLGTLNIKNFLKKVTLKYFKSDKLIENFSNYQIFLNKETIESLGFSKKEVADKIVEEIINCEGIYKAITANTLQTTYFNSGILNSLQNGYNQKFSGDVLLIPYPATLTGGRKGTSHGSGYNYDTHVPIIFYGNGIKTGKSSKRHHIIDIAPTIANLLQIEPSNAATGKVIVEALK